jgi:hypothetical protein
MEGQDMVAKSPDLCDSKDIDQGLLLLGQAYRSSYKSNGKLNGGTKVRLVCDPVVASPFFPPGLAFRQSRTNLNLEFRVVRKTNTKLESVVESRWSCDPSTGQLFRDQKLYIVEPVKIKGRSYIHVNIAGIKVRAHRLVWRLCTGNWPVNDIDHINGDSLDNRLCNLRDVQAKENNRNKSRFLTRDLPTGVYRVQRKNGYSYFAEVGAGGKSIKGPCRGTVAQALEDRKKILADLGFCKLHIDSSCGRSS